MAAPLLGATLDPLTAAALRMASEVKHAADMVSTIARVWRRARAGIRADSRWGLIGESRLADVRMDVGDES